MGPLLVVGQHNKATPKLLLRPAEPSLQTCADTKAVIVA